MKAKADMSQKKFNDLGLGTKTANEGLRALNKDGTFNVRKINVPFIERLNFFHSLITMSWTRFFSLVLLGYFTINLLFASIYMTIGMDKLTGIYGITFFDKFTETFFFSAQTITTLGYGQVAPMGLLANSIAAIESMLGLLTFALATGLLYGRFSKPSGKIKYSTIAVISPYQELNAFMFRVLNPHNNQLLEVEVTVTLTLKKSKSELRDFHLIELERSKIMFMPYTWTVVHPITKTSPLYKLTKDDLIDRDSEFIIMIKAFDESFSQTVYSRSSYKASEINWGEKFVYLVKNENNSIHIDVSRIDETEKIELNDLD